MLIAIFFDRHPAADPPDQRTERPVPACPLLSFPDHRTIEVAGRRLSALGRACRLCSRRIALVGQLLDGGTDENISVVWRRGVKAGLLIWKRKTNGEKYLRF